MSYENPETDVLTEARRKSLSESLRIIGTDELKALGERLFPLPDDPWEEKYSLFLKENAGATFYHGTTQDGFQVVYCHEANKGIWFLQDLGKGRLQPKELDLLKGIVESQ